MEAIEKQRKVLSGNLEHDLSIECLLEDEDLYYSMKREEYEKICQPVIQKFKNMLLEFLNELKQKGITFDLIELIGGGTRIPAIINVIA
jgi:molecular chaperone DnaK (HSP70)